MLVFHLISDSASNLIKFVKKKLASFPLLLFLTSFLSLSLFVPTTHTVAIDQNVICFVPFYIMYIFFLTIHIKFAYSTYRIALRYLALNNCLRNSKAYRKFSFFPFFWRECVNDIHCVCVCARVADFSRIIWFLINIIFRIILRWHFSVSLSLSTDFCYALNTTSCIKTCRAGFMAKQWTGKSAIHRPVLEAI